MNMEGYYTLNNPGYSYADEREKKKQIQAQYRDEERRLIERLQALTGSPDKRATVLSRAADTMENLSHKVDLLVQENQVLTSRMNELREQNRQLQAWLQTQNGFNKGYWPQ